MSFHFRLFLNLLFELVFSQNMDSSHAIKVSYLASESYHNSFRFCKWYVKVYEQSLLSHQEETTLTFQTSVYSVFLLAGHNAA